MRRLGKLLLKFDFLLIAIVFALALYALREAQTERRITGEQKKTSSGFSYLKETRVALAPTAAPATGFDSERVWSGYDDWEPAIASDPSSSYVYQMTTRYNGPSACKGCPYPYIIFRSSSDSGATWSADKFLAISKKKQNDPMIEVASTGVIYAAWLDDYSPGVKFLKSTNRGASWSTPIQFTGQGKKPNWNDRPILAISATGQHVYIAFNASDSYVVSSHDYGATWSTAVKTNSDTRYWFHTGGAVAPNGTVYFVAADFSQDYTGNSYIDVLRSTNGGANWTTTRVDTSAQMPDCPWAAGCTLGFFGPSPALAVDSNGRVVIAYNAGDTAGSAERMYTRYSVDGITWSNRIEVSNGSSNVNNGFPALAASAGNDFRLIWQDDRNGYTTAFNTWYRRSQDGGATWSSAVRVSDLSNGAPYKSASGYLFPYGDYLEIATDNTGRNHMIWGEGSSYTGPGGTWYTRGQ